MTCIQTINFATIFTCILGVGLSYYAYFVETSKEFDENYVAMCDISEHMSCSKVFRSEYGKGFGVVGRLLGEDSLFYQPNGLGGIIFYTIIALLSLSNSLVATKVQIGLWLVSNLMTIYLAYILYFILSDFCVVCVSTYVVNFIGLLLVSAKHRHLVATKLTNKKSAQKKKK